MNIAEIYKSSLVAENVPKIYKGDIIIFERNSYDIATEALMDQAATDGYTACSGDVLTALDARIKAEKAQEVAMGVTIWDEEDVEYVLATNGDADFSRYNIKDPTSFYLQKFGSPTFTSLQGWTGNGTDGYFDSGFNPRTDGVNFQTNSSSIGVYQRTNSAWPAGGITFGVVSDANANIISPLWRGAKFVRLNNGTGGSGSIPNLTNVGLNFINRSSSSEFELYSRGNLHGTQARAATNTPNNNLFLLATNNLGSPAAYSTDQAAGYFVGGDLSGVASELHTINQNYMTALGTQV